MNGAQLHLALNHLPVIVPLVGVAVLFGGVFWRSESARLIALRIFFASAILAIPVYLTGEPAESVVKNYPEISRTQIHDHEESAEQALVVIEILGVASAGILIAHHRRRRIVKAAWIVVSLLSLGTVGVMLRTAHLGGLIRHEEIADRGF